MEPFTVEGMAWRESLSQRKSASDETSDIAAPTAPPVVIDDTSQLDTAGMSEMNGDLPLKGITSPNFGTGLCMPASSAVNVSHINYELVGIVVHSGQANAGHYYSFIKDRRYAVFSLYELSVMPFICDY